MNKYNEKVHFIFDKFWLPSVSNHKTNYNQLFIFIRIKLIIDI